MDAAAELGMVAAGVVAASVAIMDPSGLMLKLISPHGQFFLLPFE